MKKKTMSLLLAASMAAASLAGGNRSGGGILRTHQPYRMGSLHRDRRRCAPRNREYVQ